MKKLWENPEYRAKQVAILAAANAARKTSRAGIPDGMNKEQADAAWVVAEEKAKAVIQKMKDEGDLPEIVVPGSDDEKAEQALKEAFKIALGPMTHQLTKLSALNTVLKYTKSPPETKSKLTINNAEAWLSEVAKANNDPAEKSGADTGA